MPTQLTPRGIAKPWGVPSLPPALAGHAAGERTGEIWFEGDAAAPLLVKWLFTSERLSVQVHPDDAGARAIGLPHGKDEAWYVVAAAPGATIGIGIGGAPGREAVAAAARDGSIVDMMEWREVAAGDVLYVPGGTIHALGGGLQLVEIQQALDLTWRLYDYGRPRELHLAEGLAAARLAPFGANAPRRAIDPRRTARCEGGKFVIEELAGAWAGQIAGARGSVWLVALTDDGQLGDTAVAAGSVWRIDADTPASLAADARWLLAYAAPAADPARLAA
ncbi:hypothetical protein IP88_03375 [alpha proteobacterium AAP81b]|nr:hypothetical protein IP88_03375 [alpha proteobacterium AAP81b]